MRERRLKLPLGWFGVAALVVCVVAAPSFFTHFRVYQLAFVAIYLIALLGLNLLTGYTGQISLGHGAFMGIGAYTTTRIVVVEAPMPMNAPCPSEIWPVYPVSRFSPSSAIR